jgi:hypothetical protein
MDITDIDTGSYDSRKFLLTLVGTILVTGFAIGAGFLQGWREVLPTFIGGVLGVLGLYFGVNVANKAVIGSIATKQLAINTPTTPEEKEGEV